MSTVGYDTEKVRKYIQEQEKYDKEQDEQSAVEYENPFKGN